MHKLMFLMAVMIVGMAASSRAQDRMPPIPADKLTDSQKKALAIQGGLKKEVAAAIAENRRPAGMAEDEDAVYTLWEEVQRNQGVSDATYARAVAKVGEQGVIDVLGITGYYTMLAMVMNTTRTPLPEGATPGLAPLPR